MKDIKTIIEQIKQRIVNDSDVYDDISHLIKIPTSEELEVITDLFKTYRFSNSAYDEDEIENLSKYNVPPVVIDFYKEFSTIEGIDLGGDVVFLSLEVIKKYVVEINSTFTGFLKMLINKEIDDIEEYLD